MRRRAGGRRRGGGTAARRRRRRRRRRGGRRIPGRKHRRHCHPRYRFRWRNVARGGGVGAEGQGDVEAGVRELDDVVAVLVVRALAVVVAVVVRVVVPRPLDVDVVVGAHLHRHRVEVVLGGGVGLHDVAALPLHVEVVDVLVHRDRRRPRLDREGVSAVLEGAAVLVRVDRELEERVGVVVVARVEEAAEVDGRVLDGERRERLVRAVVAVRVVVHLRRDVGRRPDLARRLARRLVHTASQARVGGGDAQKEERSSRRRRSGRRRPRDLRGWGGGAVSGKGGGGAGREVAGAGGAGRAVSPKCSSSPRCRSGRCPGVVALDGGGDALGRGSEYSHLLPAAPQSAALFSCIFVQ